MNVNQPLLTKQSTIGVFSPSSWVEEKDVRESAAFLESLGYKVFIHPQTFFRHNQFAGTLEEKRDALYALWDNPEITHIWAAGGGNRALHLIDILDFERLKTPKTLIGFSDVTVLLNALYAVHGHNAIHAPTFGRLFKSPQRDQCVQLLSGDFSAIMPLDNAHIIRTGKAEGKLIGGNLSLFHYLPNLLPSHFWQTGILFIEDCNEELSRIDRMLQYLKQCGVLAGITGLICGQFDPILNTGRPYGLSLEDLIREHTAPYNYPVIMNAPFGHEKELFPLPIGKMACLSVDKNGSSLSFE